MPDETEPDAPDEVCYDLEEALALLNDLEASQLTMVEGGFLSGVVGLDVQIRLLNRKLRFDE